MINNFQQDLESKLSGFNHKIKSSADNDKESYNISVDLSNGVKREVKFYIIKIDHKLKNVRIIQSLAMFNMINWKLLSIEIDNLLKQYSEQRNYFYHNPLRYKLKNPAQLEIVFSQYV